LFYNPKIEFNKEILAIRIAVSPFSALSNFSFAAALKFLSSVKN